MTHTLNWKDLYVEKFKENGFSQGEIEITYSLEMELRAFFDFGGIIPICLKLQNIEKDENEIRYYWKSDSDGAQCPYCGMVSGQPYDYLEKPVQDIPRDNRAVYHIIRSKRYFCKNEQCDYSRFVERFYEFTEEDARKTLRFKKYCTDRSLGCGCLHAENELKAEGGVVSNDSIARYLKAKAAEKVEANITSNNVKVLAVDDINLRKGDKSSGCTVFVDEETHKVLIIIKGTTKEATKRVIEKFSSALYLSRDRATSYSAAGNECEKIQIADRFHLIKNAKDAVKDALMAEIPATIFIRNGEGWVQTIDEDSSSANASFHVSEQSVEDRIRLAGLTPTKATKYRNTLKMLELADKGLRTADIAQAMNIPYKDVQVLRRTAASTIGFVENKINARLAELNHSTPSIIETPGRHAEKTVAGNKIRSTSESIVEPYKETVISMWKAGGNHRTIYPAIQEAGYTGSKNAIYQYILKLGKEFPDEMHREKVIKSDKKTWEDEFDSELAEERPELSLESMARNNVYKALLKEASSKRNTDKKSEKQESKPAEKKPQRTVKSSYLSEQANELIFGTADETNVSSEDGKSKKKTGFENLIKAEKQYPVIGVLTQFMVDCYDVFDSCDTGLLDMFLVKYKDCGIYSLEQYVKGLCDDYAAVKNSLIYKNISNGPSEACNSRIKMLHRRSTGRAGLELLNAYVILAAASC